MNIDWSFIVEVEGRRLKAYVPQKDGRVIGKSGITVGVGIDLGQRTSEQIKALPIPGELKVKILPYAAKRMEEAVKFLYERPLTLTSEEADYLSYAVINQDLRIVEIWFHRETGLQLSSMPPEVQTVIASLAINFGPSLHVKLPQTWKLITSRDWVGLMEKLDNFPGKNPELQTRRKKEAAIIRKMING